MDKLPRVSASKLKLYEECPKRYVHQYINKNKGKQNIWAILGSSAHKAFELYDKEQKPVLQTFAERTNEQIQPDMEGFEYFENSFSGIVKGLRAYDGERYKPKIHNEKMQLERYFRLPYPNDSAAICTIEGYIDKVTISNSVLDYKTGSENVSKKAMKEDLQFIIYAWAFPIIYGESLNSVIHYRVRNNKITEQTFFDFEKLDTIIRQFINDPMEYDLEPCIKCPLIRWCPLHESKNVIG